MSPAFDFEWHEGDDSFPEQPSPTPASAISPPPATAASPAGAALPAAGFRISNLALLLIGVVLGIGAGFILLGVQGQRNARRDIAPLLALQYRALRQGDADLYASLLGGENEDWRQQQLQALALSARLYDLSQAPKVRQVKLQGDYAEAEVEFQYQGETYRQLQMLRLHDGQWQVAPVDLGGWGELSSASSEHVVLHFRQRDAFLLDHLPHIEATAAAFCERYAPPDPCRIDLGILPDSDLLPFLPGGGAAPLPPYTRYRIMGQGARAGDTDFVTINGTGLEMRDPAFRSNILLSLSEVNDARRVYAAQRGADIDRSISAQRQGGDTIPLTLISPRLVGLRGETPHPLWWLQLHEAIGDAILRRMLGPVTSTRPAALTVWAAARGDVALWAERFSGVRLADDTSFQTDPMAVGERVLFDDPRMRQAARSFALFLHAHYGEEQTLALFHAAGDWLAPDGVLAPLQSNPRLLADAWAAWVAKYNPPG